MGFPSTAPTAPRFEVFGLDHLAALGLTLLLAAWLIRRARRDPAGTRGQDRALAIFLLAIYPAHLLIGWRLDSLSKDDLLPCQLCDVAALSGALALWFRNQRAAELVWFWGLAGTLNGLFTPALDEPFPSTRFLLFFALHGGVVVTALYVVIGLRLRPMPGAVWRAFGWSQVYIAGAGALNFALGSNYGFLRSKPAQASLLDALGPWPWYILGLEAVGLVIYFLLYLPFLSRRAPAGAGCTPP